MLHLLASILPVFADLISDPTLICTYLHCIAAIFFVNSCLLAIYENFAIIGCNFHFKETADVPDFIIMKVRGLLFYGLKQIYEIPGNFRLGEFVKTRLMLNNLKTNNG